MVPDLFTVVMVTHPTLNLIQMFLLISCSRAILTLWVGEHLEPFNHPGLKNHLIMCLMTEGLLNLPDHLFSDREQLTILQWGLFGHKLPQEALLSRLKNYLQQMIKRKLCLTIVLMFWKGQMRRI